MNKQKALRLATIFLLSSILVWPFYLLGQTRQVTADASITATEVKVVSSDVTGVEFTLETAAFSQSSAGDIEVVGLEERLSRPGAPALPYFATMLILPPEADVSVSVMEAAVSSSQVARIPPMPQPDLSALDTVDDGLSPYAVVDEAGETMEYALPSLVAVEDAAVYEQNALYPDGLYEISEPGYLRDLRVVELRLYPLRYNPVSGELRQAQAVHVQVSFVGAQWENLRPSANHHDSPQSSQADNALNYEQGQHWRGFPSQVQNASNTELPLGVDVYKIELNQDGLYELTGADFAAAGMNIANVNPDTLQMLYRGQPMAYQLIGDNGDSDFDPTEKIRFYGWAFDGPRTDKQFVSNNVLWVWAGGTPTYMDSHPNETGMGHPIDTNSLAEITREPENSFFATWTRWETFPNEPDAWFWDFINKPFTTITRTYTTTLYHPDPTGPAATYLIEFNSRRNLTTQPHIIHARINSNPNFATLMWQEPTIYAHTNINLTDTVPANDLLNGTNSLTVVYDTATTDQLYLNRITVEYQRQLVAVNNQLLFRDEIGSAREFQVSSFTEGNVNNVLVWDVSVPTSTIEIQMNSSDIVNNGGTFTYKVGSTHPAESQFLVTTAANILTANDLAASISQYMPQSLDPPGGEAEWLAISHGDFMAQASQLATHRANPSFGDMTTHVVDIDDVINQYGYGLPLPQAIQDYLSYALGNWTVAPSYVVLVGDATQNPRNLDCLVGCTVWDKDEVNFLLTDLLFVDRYQGLIPSDFTFALLSGDDLFADLAIGRIAAKTQTEAASMVAKIIEFETNQLDPQNNEWQRNMLFVADNYDPNAGNFCLANELTADSLPHSLEQIHLCLPGEDGTNPPTPLQVQEVRSAMSQTVNITGTTMLNYRGHGAITTWTGNGLLSAQMTDFWQNNGRPLMIISADCLDGHFAWPGFQGLGEVVLKLDDRGSAAHWASSGLGSTYEHTVLHVGFYDGIFAEGLTAIGDAVNYAKLVYINDDNHESEAYSFNLQGDPAMQLFRPDIAVNKQALPTSVDPGDPVDFVVTVSNEGLYPTGAIVTDTLPIDLDFVSAVVSTPGVSAVVVGNQITVEFTEPLHWGDEALITVTANTMNDFIGITTNWATADNSAGSDLNESNDTASAIVNSTVPSVVLTSYTAVPLDNEVQLDWSVSAEVNLVGYKIMRAEGGGPFIWLQNLGNNGVIPAQGNAPADYQALDTTAVNGRTYHYRLLALQDNMSEVDLGVRTVTLMDVEIVSFTASPLSNAALLEWTTQAEFNIGAYRIERGHNGTFIWLQGLGDNGYIPAKGGPQLTANYAVTDNTAVNGNTYNYRLIAVQDEPSTLEREVGQDTLVLNPPIFMPLLVRP